MTVNNMEEDDEKPRTLLVGNIPREVHKREIEDIFGEIGPLKRCYIQYPRDDKKKKSGGDASSNTLMGYVTYALSQDAVTAMETLANHKIGGSKVYIKFAKTRSEQIRPPLEPSEDQNPTENETGDGERPVRSRGDRERPPRPPRDTDGAKGNPNRIPIEGDKQQQKPPRPKPVNKKSRLIVRNLSFRVTEEKVREYFGTCGEIKDINILKKPDGKLVGCAFVQFNTVPQAAKAVRELNLKPFLGRPIAIDWALSKKDFQDGGDGAEKKPEIIEVTEIKSENEDEGEDEVEDVKIKIEPEHEPEVKFVSPYEHLKNSNLKFEDESENKNRKRKLKKEQSDSEDNEDDDNENAEAKRPKRSNDVEEGKTLFIRNLDFSVTEEQLKEFFEGYGQTHYALLCRDHLTEHPKGTGFVKFKELESANKCLVDFNVNVTNFKLGRRPFAVSIALSREKVESKSTEGKDDKVKHDNRNLYLVREGFIRPGSGGADGVSAADMNKRAALNSTKKQMLKNLSIFVSGVRLCVHNLPPKFSDKGLRRLFKKYSDPKARITEARIMRDMKDIQLGGKGMSKGYGFVTFTEHEHALEALRAINNNPDIFTPNSRPIVEFSLENRKALQAKQKREAKSVENNKNVPQQQSTKNKKKNKKRPNSENNKDKPEVAIKPNKPSEPKTDDNSEEKVPGFAGLVGKHGVSKLPQSKPKGTGKITRKSLKGSKPKKFQDRRMREPQIKPKKQIDKPDKTEKIVSRYRKQLAGGSRNSDKRNQSKSGKWYN